MGLVRLSMPKRFQSRLTDPELSGDPVAELSAGSPNRLSLPEYRQIELYSKRKSLSFAPAATDGGRPLGRIAGVCRSFLVLDAFLGESSPSHLMTREAFTEIRRVLKLDQK